MKALVLSGGGAKGSYQIGVWKALRELNIHFDIITGTSSGALNGALMTQNSYHKAKVLWKKINNRVLFGDNAVESTNNIDVYKMYAKEFLKRGGMDVQELEAIIKGAINVDKLYNSKIKFGLVTYNLTKKKVYELSKDEIDKDKMADYLMASATCYPAFQKKDIEGLEFIDGGYYDNLPISLAQKLGADEIIAVDLRAPGIKRHVKTKANNIIYIRPNNKLTSFLNFYKEGAKKNIAFGYNDTLKVFNKLEGKRFTFRKGELALNSKKYIETYTYVVQEIINSNRLINDFKKLNKLPNIDTDSIKEILFNDIMQSTGHHLNLDETKIYKAKSYNKKIKKIVTDSIKKNNITKEIEYYLMIKEGNYKELRKKIFINPRDVLRAIYIYSLFEN